VPTCRSITEKTFGVGCAMASGCVDLSALPANEPPHGTAGAVEAAGWGQPVTCAPVVADGSDSCWGWYGRALSRCESQAQIREMCGLNTATM
jgi:hypothetical protein